MLRFLTLFLVGTLFFLSAPLSAQKEDAAEWTFLIFLNADNNLHGAGLDDLSEMKSVGSSRDVNVLVQFDGNKRGDSKRYFVEQNKLTVVDDFESLSGEVDMGDWKNFKDFILWGALNYPAKKYFVAVWNHGSGALSALTIRQNIQAISFDDTSGNFITTVQLGYALRELRDLLGRKVDIYGSDACLMGMFEVAYELKNYVDYVVGSEALEPFDGWPYDTFLEEVTAFPKMDALEAGSWLVKKYVESYGEQSNQPDEATLSLISSAFSDMLRDWLGYLAIELKYMLPQNRDSIMAILKDTQGYGYASSRDIYDFVRRLSTIETESECFNEATTQALKLLNQAIVSSEYVGYKYRNSHGLGLWLPDNPMSFKYDREEYLKLKFGSESIWLEFLDSLYEH